MLDSSVPVFSIGCQVKRRLLHLESSYLRQYPIEDVLQTVLLVKTEPCYISQHYAMDYFTVLTVLVPSTYLLSRQVSVC